MLRTAILLPFATVISVLAASSMIGCDEPVAPTLPERVATGPTAAELLAIDKARRPPATAQVATPIAQLPATTPQAAPPPPIGEAARELYAQNCAPCHGEAGRGDGALAQALAPPPRDFAHVTMKFASNARGIPSDDDLARVILRGLPGSGMPAATHLARGDALALAAVVRRFAFEGRIADLLADDAELEASEAAEIAADLVSAGPPLEVPPRPSVAPDYPPATLFSNYCAECHCNDGTARGAFDTELFDDAGWPLRARDLTHERLKGGATDQDIATRILRGIPGTPMPATTVRPKHIWALVDRVQQIRASAAAAMETGAPVGAAGGRAGGPGRATRVPLSPLRGDGLDARVVELRLALTNDGFAADLRLEASTPGARVGAAIRLSSAERPPFAWSPGSRAPLWRTDYAGPDSGPATTPRRRSDAIVAEPAQAPTQRDPVRTLRLAATLTSGRPTWIAVAVWEVSEDGESVREGISAWHPIAVRP